MRTLPLIFILLVALFSSNTFAQDCNNPLLVLFGFVGTGTPQSGSGLQFCNNLQSGQTCCDANVVGAFQDKANALIERLNNYFAAKDLYLAQLRNSYLERFDYFLDNINGHNPQLQAIRLANSTIADQLQSNINTATQLNNDARNINSQFNAALSNYQKDRTACFNIALQVQASAWCLACDPNYATEGVNPNGTVTFSDGLCQAISDNCWPFFNDGATFNPLIKVRQAYWNLAAVSEYLNAFANNNQILPFTVPSDPYNPLPTQQPVVVPMQFIAGSPGAGSCTNLWAGDEALAQILTIGASVPTLNATTGLLQNNPAGPSGIWAPSYAATGLNFSALRFDPGDYFGVGNFSVVAEFINEENLLDLNEEWNFDQMIVLSPGDIVGTHNG